MQTIASFQIDHDVLTPGMYVSRVDGDVVTYDLRFKRPNAGDYLENGALHTIEHLFATYARNSRFGGQVVYKPTGEVVEWAGWSPKAAKTAAVRGCKPEDVMRAFGPRLASVDAIALLDGEVE